MERYLLKRRIFLEQRAGQMESSADSVSGYTEAETVHTTDGEAGGSPQLHPLPPPLLPQLLQPPQSSLDRRTLYQQRRKLTDEWQREQRELRAAYQLRRKQLRKQQHQPRQTDGIGANSQSA